VERIGAVAIPIPYQIAVHVPELAAVRDAWWALHHRDTTEVPGVRFYSGASGTSYQPTAAAAADALTAQAMATIDFAAVVRNAWDDGVRVFVEHGPRSLCTGWIQRTLAGREHLAVALDGPEGRGIGQLAHAVAELAAAGLPVRDDRLFEHLATGWQPAPERTATTLRIPAHPPAVRLPDPGEHRMEPAPALPAPASADPLPAPGPVAARPPAVASATDPAPVPPAAVSPSAVPPAGVPLP